MKTYNVMNADETACYTHGHEDMYTAMAALSISRSHDPEAHIVELEVETLDEKIERLEAELEAAKEREKGLSIMLTSAQSAAETYKRERDAAVADINMCCPCEVCTRSCTYDKVNPYDECADFEWRGVKNDA